MSNKSAQLHGRSRLAAEKQCTQKKKREKQWTMLLETNGTENIGATLLC